MGETAKKPRGKLQLFPDPLEVINRDYEDNFDLAKSIAERDGFKLLYFRAKLISADEVNQNGDYFSTEELLKERKHNGKKIPTYKTFVGVPVYVNHRNKNVDEAKGEIIYVEWNQEEKAVYGIAYISCDAYPDLEHGLRLGFMHDVSMGAAVEGGICSVCGKFAQSENEWCTHLKNYKGKYLPGSGEKVYEKNVGIKFIELSIVSVGAYDTCKILDLYDPEDILSAAAKLGRRQEALAFRMASLQADGESEEIKQFRITSNELMQTMNKFAQQIQNDPQLLATPGGNSNATVTKILRFLGIDPSRPLNTLDLLNLSLNFMEVSVMQLFNRKDNVNLSHVSKITKCMSDVQNTMQNMIDDGIDVNLGTPGGQGIMLTPGILGAPQGNPTNPQGNDAQGTIQLPNVMPNQQFNAPPKVAFLDHNGERILVRTASKSDRFTDAVLRLAMQVISIDDENQDSNKEVRASSNKKTNKGNMDIIKNTIQNLLKRNAVVVAADLHFEDNNGNRVTIANNGTIRGTYNEQVIASWNPTLTANQIDMLQDEEARASVGNQLLDSLRTAASDLLTTEEKLTVDFDKSELADKEEESFNARLVRKNNEDPEQISKLLADKLKTETDMSVSQMLFDKALESVGEQTLEEMLATNRGSKPEQTDSIFWRKFSTAVLDELGRYATTYKILPEKVVERVASLSLNDHTETDLIAALAIATVNERRASVFGDDPNLGDEKADLYTAMARAMLRCGAKSGDVLAVMRSIREHVDEVVYALEKRTGTCGCDGEAHASPVEIGIVAATSDLGADLDPEALRVAYLSLSASGIENNRTAKEVLSAFDGLEASDILGLLKTNRSAGNVRTASSNLKTSSIALAKELAEATDMPFEKLANALCEVCKNAVISEQVINEKIASVTINENNTKTIDFVCSSKELPFSTDDTDFDEKLRTWVGHTLRQANYPIDPITFSLTNVRVSDTGDVVASITNQFSRTRTMGTHNPEPLAMPNVIMTPTAAESGASERFAQMMAAPQMQGFGMPAMPDPNAGMTDLFGASGAPAGDPNAPPAPGMEAPPAPEQGAPEPANAASADKIVAPGTRCPACMSENTDFDAASGIGNCQNCNTQYKVKLTFEFFPNGGLNKTGEGVPEAQPVAPEAPAGPEAAGQVPALVQASFSIDAEDILRYAQASQQERVAYKKLVPGNACLNCKNSDRMTFSASNGEYICAECNSIAKISMQPSRQKGQLDCVIAYTF